MSVHHVYAWYQGGQKEVNWSDRQLWAALELLNTDSVRAWERPMPLIVEPALQPLVLLFRDKFLLLSSGWPRSCYVIEADLELVTILPLSAPWKVGLQVCTTTPDCQEFFYSRCSCEGNCRGASKLLLVWLRGSLFSCLGEVESRGGQNGFQAFRQPDRYLGYQRV